MKKFFLLFAVLVGVNISPAEAACEFRPTDAAPLTEAAIYQMPITIGKISVGPDVPIGQVIYRQTINIMKNRLPYIIGCDTYPVKKFYKYTQLPLPASAVTAQGISGTVYETGLKGIGIVFWYSGNAFPFSQTLCGTVPVCLGQTGEGATSDFSLVKIGPVEPGEISASNLPSVEYTAGVSESDSLSVVKISFTGSVSVSVPSCQIEKPNDVVSLGRHNINEFSGKGSYTPWKDASIRLINCPFFYGNTNYTGNAAGTFDGATINASSTSLRNAWSLKITPGNGVIDSARGVISVSDTEDSAGGLGIQLASSPDDTAFLNLSSSYTGLIPADGASSVTIPLYARYIQTSDTIKAGIANGFVTYLLEYK
ncbi:TPA: fimbrial protein [Klebsiella quasipneumoniae subsp. similipneumoniae]